MDAKGRLIIPARFRQVFKDNGDGGLMVSTKLDGGLVAYPFDEWDKTENRLLSLAEPDEFIRRFIRFFIGSAAECPLDKQDRILIPPPLRQEAGLNKDIVLVGVLDHFEIWARDRWEQEKADLQGAMKEREDYRNKIAKLF